ncbi:Putative peptidoglycan binding domain-containing protein [Microbacterium testaceum StLB037]|uniref:Putative peptidoglycan binding domain-containing protein n=2 Tax=Microbacterium testaceum TaxID=2033 RepID=A0A1H0Q7Z8_MICTS|nr:Putative peptidoglycan binding domain-containing protein [Microbacterium testaceum StLB037]
MPPRFGRGRGRFVMPGNTQGVIASSTRLRARVGERLVRGPSERSAGGASQNDVLPAHSEAVTRFRLEVEVICPPNGLYENTKHVDKVKSQNKQRSKDLTRKFRMARLVVVALLVSAGAIAMPAAAQAAVPTCNFSAIYALERPLGPSGVFPSVNTSPKQRSCNLWPGGERNATIALQYQLNRCNGANLVEDGSYGPATQNAVRAVQSRAGIAVDGVYGPQTMNAMRWSNGNGCYSASSYSYAGTNG